MDKSFIIQLQLVIILAFIGYVIGQENLLKNPDFDDPFGPDDWFCNGPCNLDRVTDAHNGTYSGRITNRTANWHGMSQWVDLEPDTVYYFSCWLKLLNQLPDSMWHRLVLIIAVEYPGQTELETVNLGYLPYLKQSQGWQKAGADFYLDSREVTRGRLAVQLPAPGDTVEYLVDTASLVQVTYDPDWKQKAEQSIEEIRKDDIVINLSVSEGYDPTGIELNLNLVKHDFPFGTAVKEDQIIGTDADSLKYQNCFYDNFEWSVLENALKWKQMEWNRDTIRYPDEAIDTLLANGIPVRGHCVFWGVEDNQPEWLIPLSGEEIYQEMVKRLDYLVPRYSGKIIHWDVNNEQLHGSFYEDKLEDAFITASLFEQVRQRDSNVTLFLNDYQILNFGYYTQALVNSAFELNDLGASVQAIGLQSHLRGDQNNTTIAALQKRLEVVSTANLPLWITELDISQVTNPTNLADSYEDVLTLYFSNSNVNGVLFWGFSDQYHSKPDAALFEGPDYVPNESGLRWQMLMRERWHTSATFIPTDPEESFGVRGFQGSYHLDVLYNGDVISSQTFYLSPGSPVEVDVQV